MKLLIVQFDDTANVEAIPVSTEVTVTNGITTLTGKVLARTEMENPAPIDGLYMITEAPAQS